MSVASQWKLKEKEAAAAAAATSKTGIPGVRGKTEASAKDISCVGAVYGPMGIKGTVEISGKPETAKPGPPQATSLAKPGPPQATSLAKPGPPQATSLAKPGPPQTSLAKPGPPQATSLAKPGLPLATSFGKQGMSKLPVGKDTFKNIQTKEADAVPTKDGAVQPVDATPGSKIPVGAKENIVSVGGRKPFGAGLKKEEPSQAIRSKAEDNKVKTNELKKEPAGGAKDSTAAAAVAATATGDDGPLGPGRTKGLAGFWANQNDEVKTVKKKRLTAVEDNLTPMVVENTPQLLEGVVRAQDPGEWQKPLQVEDGWTKNVVSSFQKRQQESFSRRAPISLVEDTSSEQSDAAPDVEAAKVKVKDIFQRLTRQQSEPTKMVKEKLVIDRSQGAIVLAENQPMEVDPDVVRSDDASKEEVVLEKGRTRNLLQLWKNTEVEYNTPKTSTHRYQGSKPAWILEIEAAKGNSVDKNDEGQPEENNAMEINDESGNSGTHYEETDARTKATQHADDNRQIVSDNKASVPLPKEIDNAGVPLLKRSTDVETIQSLKARTDETNIIKLEENDRTINKEIQYAETPTTASLDIVSQVQVAEEALSDLVSKEVEITQKPLPPQLAHEIITEEARVEQSTEASVDEPNRKYEVCKQVNESEPLDRKEVLNVLLEETKSGSEDVPSSFPDQNRTLQQSSGEKEAQKLSPAPIHKASEEDSLQNELVSKQQVLSSESCGTTLDKQEPSEQVHEGTRPLPSTELKPNEFTDVSSSDASLNLTDVSKQQVLSSESSGTTLDKQEPSQQVHEGTRPLPSTELKPNEFTDVSSSDASLNLTDVRNNKNESEVVLGRNEAAITAAKDVEPIQIHDTISEGARTITNETSSRLTDEFVPNVSSIQNIVPLPQSFLGHSGKPEEAPHRVPDEALKMQPGTNFVCEENKVAMRIEDHDESSDNETFATPTKSVILSPLGSVFSAEQVESLDSEKRERTENESKTAKESSFAEGTLIDLQTESIETRRENSNLFSLDDLLQIQTSPTVDYSGADNTPCLVPLSSPSTPELTVSSERSSGVFDSDSEKCTAWFSPEETTSTTAKRETISTHDDSDYSSGSPKSKTGDGNATENKGDEQTNKTDASQRSCRVM